MSTKLKLNRTKKKNAVRFLSCLVHLVQVFLCGPHYFPFLRYQWKLLPEKLAVWLRWHFLCIPMRTEKRIFVAYYLCSIKRGCGSRKKCKLWLRPWVYTASKVDFIKVSKCVFSGDYVCIYAASETPSGVNNWISAANLLGLTVWWQSLSELP